MSGEQFHFVFPEPDLPLEAFFFGDEGAASVRVLRLWQDWPKQCLALTGPDRSGVTAVLKSWASETGARYLTPAEFMKSDAKEIADLLSTPVALDDVEHVTPSNSVLTFLNLAREQQQSVLLGGHGNPRRWHKTPPDLVSRLSAVTRLVMPVLDDDSFDKRLRAACQRRYIDLPEETLKFLRLRLERSYAAIETFAERLDAIMGTQNRPASVPVARGILASMNPTDGEPFQETD